MSIIERALDKALQDKSEHKDEKVDELASAPAVEVREKGGVSSEQDTEGREPRPEEIVEATSSLLSGKDLDKGGLYQELDWQRLREIGLLVPDLLGSSLAETFRGISKPLLDHAFPQEGKPSVRSNLIQVVGSTAMEGVTFTAVNLALLIAQETDKMVLLVDANIKKPDIGSWLGINAKQGLISLLDVRYVKVPDVIWRTQFPNLRVIPGGSQLQASGSLLSCAGMKLLTRELSERYSDRVVIFDSPPLDAEEETDLLAGQMGQVVLVVDSERTPAITVKESVEKLRTCRLVGCVLNKAGSVGAGEIPTG